MNRYKYVLTITKETIENDFYDTNVEGRTYTCVEYDENFMTILSYMLKELPIMLDKVNSEVRK